jgi:predicted ArsR family transcriptional regulator
MGDNHIDQQLAGLAGLGDPLRRALYRYVAERGVPVSRDDAADGTIRLRNCPFYHFYGNHRELVCGANHAMLQALTDRLDGDPPVRAVLDPQPGRCCVLLTRAS